MNTLYGKYIKRMLDFILALLASILLSWLLAAIAVAVRITGDGAVLFKQKRIGKGNRYFLIYKFETMSKNTPSELSTDRINVSDIEYTRIGEFLRKTSLNELPQLLNIIKGDMAIIGPRPALWNQFELNEMRNAHHVNEVRPGLTGWAQVNGRDTIDDETKVKFDTEYVNRLSFFFDCKCFFRTFRTLASFAGVAEGGGVKTPSTEEIKENQTYSSELESSDTH